MKWLIKVVNKLIIHNKAVGKWYKLIFLAQHIRYSPFNIVNYYYLCWKKRNIYFCWFNDYMWLITFGHVKLKAMTSCLPRAACCSALYNLILADPSAPTTWDQLTLLCWQQSAQFNEDLMFSDHCTWPGKNIRKSILCVSENWYWPNGWGSAMTWMWS